MRLWRRKSKASRMVAEMHKAFGRVDPKTPTMLEPDRCELRETLLEEESTEAMDEFYYASEGTGDLCRIAKELADVLVVTYGAALECGIDLDAVLVEVHASNMTKIGAPVREDGKTLKGENYRPPDIAKVLGL